MTPTAAQGVRAFAFGAPDGGVWGAAWLPVETTGFVCLGADEQTILPSIDLTGESEGEDWEARGEGVQLTLAPEGQAVAAPIGGFDQLCRVRGRFGLAAEAHQVDCLGRRAVRDAEPALDRFQSVREVSAWFEPDRGLTLMALRPGDSSGHDSDTVAAAILDPEGSVAVADPRLSTTYAPSGRPARAGLELWLEDEETEQLPRRAAGEALGPRAETLTGDRRAQAELFRWHSRDQDGVGVYLLLQRR